MVILAAAETLVPDKTGPGGGGGGAGAVELEEVVLELTGCGDRV